MTILKFGDNTTEEQNILDKAKAREITQVVLDYGINQNQIYHMIFLLAMELESTENMKKITSLVSTINETTNNKSSILIGEENE